MKVYLDYAATTPVDPRVLRAMRPYFGRKFGNPGSLHSFGQEALRAVDAAREEIAGFLGADFQEIIFTGSATEANNLALRGSLAPAASGRLRSHPDAEPSRRGSESFLKGQSPLRIVVSSIEHESVLATARDLAASSGEEASLAPAGREKEGVEVVYLPVAKSGKVLLDRLKRALNERTVLVSVMYANNEVGTVQPVAEISKVISDFKKSVSTTHRLLPTTYPLFHTDAVQAFQYLDCNVSKLGVDLLTLSGHKVYGPKGVGVLYVRLMGPIGPIGPISPILTGGGQEFGLRSGTENVPLVVGLAEALGIAAKVREREAKRVQVLRNALFRGIKKAYPRAQANTPLDRGKALPNMLNVSFPDYPAEELLTRLDLAGVAVSSGSACRSRTAEPSYVLRAMGLPRARAERSLRFSLGRPTGARDIDMVQGLVRKLFLDGKWKQK